jgi:renalase
MPDMNAICKFLSKNIEVHCNITVKRIEKSHQHKWQLFDSSDNHLGDFDWVICSTPASEAQKLLPPAFAHHHALQSIKMLGCYAMMLSFENKLNVDWDVALVKDANLSWIALNSSKPARNAATALLALASNKWAEENMETDIETIKAQMLHTLLRIMQCSDEGILDLQIHKWRYANAGKNNQFKYLLDPASKLAAIGDWCIQGRIECAFMSANQLYHALVALN